MRMPPKPTLPDVTTVNGAANIAAWAEAYAA